MFTSFLLKDKRIIPQKGEEMAETNLQVFSGEFGEIRTLIIDDEPYFVGIDVARKAGVPKR